MQTKIYTLFSQGIYSDFMRFLLTSVSVGALAAALLSLAVVALSNTTPPANTASAEKT